uniref:PB1 domain-containing protein n=1 Tax=Opuntia streptacantha TaxID=393608 RepID=A0A7C9CRB0_OPUST
MTRSTLQVSDNKSANTIKFLCSYGGKIAPRYPDGKLRYHGGHTRVLSVPRSISFSELLSKMSEMCGSSVSLRCQLPNEDLDALVTIKSDEDLANLLEEYDRFAPSSMKIRAFLSPIRTMKTPSPSPPPSEYAATSPSPKSLSPSSSFSAAGSSPRLVPVPVPVPVAAMPVFYRKGNNTAVTGGRKVVQPQAHYGCHHCYSNPSHIYLIHNGNHWQ